MGAIIDSNEELIKHTVSDEHFRTIDISYKVMHNIEKLQHKQRPELRFLKRKTILTMVVPCILLVSFTAYAATGHIQVFNDKGKIVVKTISPPTTALPTKLSNLLEKYREMVFAGLKPGELAAYYIKDDYINKTNGYDTLNPIKYEYLPIAYRSYESFLTEQVRTSAPLIKEPKYFPKGVSFSYGQVFPQQPSRGVARSEYDKLLQKLMSRANSSNDGEKLFTEKLDWSKASSTILYLSDGKNSTAISINAVYGLSMSLIQPSNASSEKIQLKDVEAIYLNDKAGKDSIAWYDSIRSIAYTISVNEEGLMSKKELEKMAASMITDESGSDAVTSDANGE